MKTEKIGLPTLCVRNAAYLAYLFKGRIQRRLRVRIGDYEGRWQWMGSQTNGGDGT